jgi:hypothetical protein
VPVSEPDSAKAAVADLLKDGVVAGADIGEWQMGVGVSTVGRVGGVGQGDARGDGRRGVGARDSRLVQIGYMVRDDGEHGSRPPPAPPHARGQRQDAGRTAEGGRTDVQHGQAAAVRERQRRGERQRREEKRLAGVVLGADQAKDRLNRRAPATPRVRVVNAPCSRSTLETTAGEAKGEAKR